MRIPVLLDSVKLATWIATVRLLRVTSCCAWMFGRYAKSMAVCVTRRRVSSATRPRPLRTCETVVIETPAASATSRMVADISSPVPHKRPFGKEYRPARYSSVGPRSRMHWRCPRGMGQLASHPRPDKKLNGSWLEIPPATASPFRPTSRKSELRERNHLPVSAPALGAYMMIETPTRHTTAPQMSYRSGRKPSATIPQSRLPTTKIPP